MTITIINDCRDPNDSGRQAARVSALLQAATVFIGVASDIEAAGNIIDALDALQGHPGIILANVAPRQGRGKTWFNGTPFGYFWRNKTLVVTTLDGLTLSLVKKFQLTERIHAVDVAQVVSQWDTTKGSKDRIVHSQFRSYDFLPRLAAQLWQGEEVPHKPFSISTIPDAPGAIWWVDTFGNCKTMLLAEDIDFKPGRPAATKLGALSSYARLKDVPDGKAALVVGSSGLEEKRFLEIVIQGQNAADHFGLSSGSLIR